MITLGRAFLLAALAAAPALAATTVTQSVEPLQIGTDDTAEVTVEVTGARGSAQVALPDSQDFQVLGRSSSTSTSIRADGSGEPVVERSQSYSFRVRPLHQGTFSIPAAEVIVDGQKFSGASAQLEVAEGHVASQQRQQATDPFDSFFGGDPFADMPSPGSLFNRAFGRLGGAPASLDAKLLVAVDKPTIYAGEQATLSVFLATRSNLSSLGNLRLPTIDGAASQDIEVAKKLAPRTLTVDGNEYQGFLVARRAVFPAKPGKMTIPAGSIEVSGGGPFEAPINRIIKSQPLSLDVKPLPPGGRPGEPVGNWKASMTLGTSAPPAVGQPLPVQVTFDGTGDLVQLPSPVLDPQGQAQVLAPTVKDTPTIKNGVVGGRRMYEFLVTPTAPGTLILPAVRLDYFNPATGRHEQASTTALTLDVGPGVATAPIASATPPSPGAAAPGPTPAATTSIEAPKNLLMIAGALGLLALAALMIVAATRAVLKLARDHAGSADASPSRRALRRNASKALADARVAAKSGRDADAMRLTEQALTSIASAVGLTPEALDVDRLAQDPTRPLQAAWAQTLLQCRRARFMTLDSERVSALLERAGRSLDELPRSSAKPPAPGAATHAS